MTILHVEKYNFHKYNIKYFIESQLIIIIIHLKKNVHTGKCHKECILIKYKLFHVNLKLWIFTKKKCQNYVKNRYIYF